MSRKPEPHGENGRRITLARPPGPRREQQVRAPADPSSAAFPLPVALVVEGSEIIVQGVITSPLAHWPVDDAARTGPDISFENCRIEGGEEVADVPARHLPNLRGVDVSRRSARPR